MIRSTFLEAQAILAAGFSRIEARLASIWGVAGQRRGYSRCDASR